MTNNYEIVERSSGYWIVDASGVVDCDLTIKQPYHLQEMAQHVLKSLEVTKENEMEHQCEEPKAPGIVRYAKKPAISPATWIEWFDKYAPLLEGTALIEAHDLYEKDKGEKNDNE